MRSLRRKEQEPTRFRAPDNAPVEAYRYDAVSGRTEILRKCLQCGEIMPRAGKILEACPSCRAPKTEFILVDED